jgi:hypothetical protein
MALSPTTFKSGKNTNSSKTSQPQRLDAIQRPFPAILFLPDQLSLTLINFIHLRSVPAIVPFNTVAFRPAIYFISRLPF